MAQSLIVSLYFALSSAEELINILIPKFLLLMIVYLFINAAIISEYSFFQKAEYEESRSGHNYIFTDLDDHRIVIHKADRTPYSREDIEKVRNLNNIKMVIENDLTTDEPFSLTSEDE